MKRLGCILAFLSWLLGPEAFSFSVEMASIGSWPGYPTGSARGVAIKGQFAYVVVQEAELMVLDISDSRKPTRVAGFPGQYYSITKIGDLLVAADMQEGIALFDAAGPGVARFLKVIPVISGNARGAYWVLASGNYVFGGIVGPTTGGRVEGFDISDLNAPVKIFSALANEQPALFGNGLYYRTVNNAGRWFRFATRQTVDRSEGLLSASAASGNFTYVSRPEPPGFAPSRISTFDFSNPASPTVVGTASETLQSPAHWMSVKGDRLFVFGYDPAVYSITNPAAPTLNITT